VSVKKEKLSVFFFVENGMNFKSHDFYQKAVYSCLERSKYNMNTFQTQEKMFLTFLINFLGWSKIGQKYHFE